MSRPGGVSLGYWPVEQHLARPDPFALPPFIAHPARPEPRVTARPNFPTMRTWEDSVLRACYSIVRGASLATAKRFNGGVMRFLFQLLTLLSSLAFAESLTGVAAIIKGDTLEIRSERIRRNGIDTPESARLCRKLELPDRGPMILCS